METDVAPIYNKIMTIKEQKEKLIEQLEHLSDSPALEATELIIFATDLDRSGILYKQNEKLSSSAIKNISSALSKRKKGIPLQYILGEWEFYSLPFKVGKGVLIPRADSELLVDLALDELDHSEERTLLDLCSGSGALGIAISKNAKNAKVTLVEKNRKAFGYLKENVKLNNANVKAVRADIFKWAPQNAADIVVCNPPYISKEEMHSLQREVKHEPTVALLGGKDGLKFYRLLAKKATDFLKPKGKMLVEIGFSQAQDVMQLFAESGFEHIECFKDLNGNDRVISAILK